MVLAAANRNATESDDSSFEYPAMMLGNQYNLESVVRNARKSDHIVPVSDQSRKKIMRMVSGDERFLNSYSSRVPYQSQPHEYTNTETQKEALQIISQLNSGVGTTNQNNQSLDDYQMMGRTDENSSFQHALYPNCMQSSLVQNLSQVSIEHEESKDSLQLLKQNGINPNPYASTQPSNYFLHTNASIFERNPFQDFTASKLNALVLNGAKSAGHASASGGSIDYSGVEQLLQMREDALKYITQLEHGWIARQESLKLLSPTQSHRRRYELEQWVNTQRQSARPVDQTTSGGSGEFKPSATQVRHFCRQVGAILETVNKKADEIREQLYQRSQDSRVKRQQIEGYQEMHLYKKALGIGSKDEAGPTGEIKSLDNIDVIDQSQEQIEDQAPELGAPAAPTDGTGEPEADKEQAAELEISLDEQTEDEQMTSPPRAPPTRLNADILGTPTSEEAAVESLGESEANERLAEEVTDRILKQMLNEELSTNELSLVFRRIKPRAVVPSDRRHTGSPPQGARTAGSGLSTGREPTLEVAVTSE